MSAGGKKRGGSPKRKPTRKQGPATRRKPTGRPRGPRGGKLRPARPVALQWVDSLWFRASTRVKALGYWFAEKAAAVGDRFGAGLAALRGPLRRAEEAWSAGRAWLSGLDPLRRRALAGLTAFLALAFVWILVPLPGVPCGWTPVKACPPADEAAELVPADALVFGRLSLDRDTAQYERADSISKRLPDLEAIFDGAGTAIGATGQVASFADDVLPWADGELGFAQVPGSGTQTHRVAIAGIGNEEDAEAFLARFGGDGDRSEDRYGAELSLYAGGLASARIDDRLLFGSAEGVEACLRTAAGEGASIAEGEPAAREDLPAQRFADVFVSGKGARRLLANSPSGSGAAQLDTFVDYSSTAGFAASFAATSKGIEVEIVSELSPRATKRERSALAGLAAFDASLLQLAPPDTLAYLGAGDFRAAVTDRRRGGLGGAFGGALAALDRDLRGRGGGNALDQLLPLLEGEAALILEPTGGLPAFTLVVDEVRVGRVVRAMADLQAPLARAYGSPDRRRVARFERFRLAGGEEGYSLDAAPGLELSYAVVDGRLLFSNSRRSLAGVASAAGGLTDSAAYASVAPQVEEGASAILFVNLDEVLGLVELAGLAEDPLYASISDDIKRSGALALTVTGEPDRLVSRLLLAAPR